MTRGHFQNKSVYLCVQYLIIITCEYSSTWWILKAYPLANYYWNESFKTVFIVGSV